MSLALYIHWPFCLKKCPYCDFNSHVRAESDIAAWQSALVADMRYEAAQTGDRTLSSIFFGGGTPSLMPPGLVAALIEEACRLWQPAPDMEITLEANPSSVEAARFADLARAGVNRTSLGLQSLDDKALNFLGRLHDSAEGVAALEVAQRHFQRVSFDLIYARPDQDENAWQGELQRSLSFGTEHLSVYQLTIEPGTRFATDYRLGRFTLPDEERAANLFAMTEEMTRQAGLPAYETSNHARPGAESRHNLTYWQYGDYVGVGPGAHGRRKGVATSRHRKPENYLSAVIADGHGIVERRTLAASEQAAEALMMGLRLAEGIDLGRLAARFGIAPDRMVNAEKVAFFARMGLLARNGARLSVTTEGRFLLDGLLGEIVNDTLLATSA